MLEYCTLQRKIVRSFGEVQKFNEKTPIHSYPQFMAVTPNGKYIFVATTTGYLKKYHSFSGNLVHDFGCVFGKFAFLKSLKITPDGRYLFSLNQNGNMLRYSVTNYLEKNRLVNLGKVGNNCNTEIEISKNSKFLYFGSGNKLLVYNIEKNRIVKEVDCEEKGCLWSIRLSGCGNFIYCGTSCYKEQNFDLDSSDDDFKSEDSNSMMIEENTIMSEQKDSGTTSHL